MQIIQDDLWLCSDCTQVACNGRPNEIELVDSEATLAGLAELGPNLVPDFDSDSMDGIHEFSRRPCQSCTTQLAGYRARFAILGD